MFCVSSLLFLAHLQVLARANATNYGLAAGVFTKSMSLANKLSRGLQAGMVWVNCW